VEAAQELGAASSANYIGFVNALYKDPESVAEFLIEVGREEE
jgi:hypothetical protein